MPQRQVHHAQHRHARCDATVRHELASVRGVSLGRTSLRISSSSKALSLFASDVEDVILALIHPVNVLRQTDVVLSRLGGLDAQQLRNLGMVGGILMDAELDALAILYINFLQSSFFSALSANVSRHLLTKFS